MNANHTGQEVMSNNKRFAKPLRWETGFGGSNPPLSDTESVSRRLEASNSSFSWAGSIAMMGTYRQWVHSLSGRDRSCLPLVGGCHRENVGKLYCPSVFHQSRSPPSSRLRVESAKDCEIG